MHQDPVVIASYARTPMGGFQGALAPLKATDLGAAAVKAAVERAGVAADAVERIYMGCVLPAGLGQAPARQAALGAGLGLNTQATTVNKMCGSGMQAAIMAHEALAAGAAIVVGLVVRMGLFVLTPTIYGVDNTILYLPNGLFDATFDGYPTFLAFLASLITYVVVALMRPPAPLRGLDIQVAEDIDEALAAAAGWILTQLSLPVL